LKTSRISIPKTFPFRAFLLPLLALVTFECIQKPLSPVAPTTDLQLSAPLIDRTGTIGGMLSRDTSKVKQSSDGGFYYSDREPGTTKGIDTIKATANSNSQQVSVGKIGVAAVPSQNSSITASQLGLAPGSVPNGFPFPASSGSAPPISFDLSSQFDFLAVDTGSLTITIMNTLPVSVSFPSGIILKNNKTTVPSDTATIAFFPFGTLAHNQSQTLTASLASKMLRGAIEIDSIKFNTGAMTGPFTIQSTDGLTFTFSSTPFQVDSAAAVIPNQTLAAINDTVITIDDSLTISQATFRSGKFNATVVNNLGINVGINLKFSNFVNPATLDTFRIQQQLTPHQTFTALVNVDTLNIVKPTPDPTGTQMKFSVGITAINSSGAKATVTSNDFVRASFTPLSPFILKSVTGKIKPTTVPINSGSPGLQLGTVSQKFTGTFSFDSVRIAVNLGMSSGFPIQYNLHLIAMNRKTGRIDSVIVPVSTVNPGINNTTPIILDNSNGLNTFIAGFVPSFPDSFIVRGSVIINPNFVSQTIYDTSKVFISSVDTYFPLKLGITNGQYVDIVPIKGTFDSATVSAVQQAAISFTIDNGIPLQFGFQACFLGLNKATNKRDTLVKLPQSGPAYTILGSPVDAGGSSNGINTSQFTVAVAVADMQNIAASDSVFVRYTTQTSGTTGQAVKVRTSDSIRLRAGATLTYQINKPK